MLRSGGTAGLGTQYALFTRACKLKVLLPALAED